MITQTLSYSCWSQVDGGGEKHDFFFAVTTTIDTTDCLVHTSGSLVASELQALFNFGSRMDLSGYRLVRRYRPRSRRRRDRWGPSFPHGRGHSSPHFSVHFTLARTVAHISCCWALV